jgi:hypothetical protein
VRMLVELVIEQEGGEVLINQNLRKQIKKR